MSSLVSCAMFPKKCLEMYFKKNTVYECFQRPDVRRRTSWTPVGSIQMYTLPETNFSRQNWCLKKIKRVCYTPSKEQTYPKDTFESIIFGFSRLVGYGSHFHWRVYVPFLWLGFSNITISPPGPVKWWLHPSFAKRLVELPRANVPPGRAPGCLGGYVQYTNTSDDICIYICIC